MTYSTMISRLAKVSSLLVLTAILANPARAQTAEPFTTIILVRHAEKDSAGVNPSLTVRGMERARALDRTLSGIRISTVYVTQFLRTQQTAQGVVKRLKITPVVFDVDLSKPRQYAKALADDIVRKHSGETVLVANHSNLLPFIVEALGAGKIGEIGDRTYDDIFIVVKHASGSATLLKLKYGSPSE